MAMHWIQLLSPSRLHVSAKASVGDIRSEFDKDYDRLIFSNPFRRLQDKTQVLPFPERDFVHTRLTHSLEVSSVGRTLGKLAGEYILKTYPELVEKGYTSQDVGAIVAAACLAHDIGNPPFGHAGEDAISEFFLKTNILSSLSLTPKEMEDMTHFEGNAQGFRILNKSHYQGLKLTSATLAAFTKYPCESLLHDRDVKRKSQKKYGFFQTERHAFKKLADEVGLYPLAHATDEYIWCRHPLAFLVEAADDICYSIIDLEDACRLGFIPFDEVYDLLIEILGNDFTPAKFSRVKDQNEKVGLLRALVIGKLVDQVANTFFQYESQILNHQFDRALTDLIESRDALKKIIEVSVQKIYNARIVIETQTVGYEVIHGLLEIFCEAVIDAKRGEGRSFKNKNIIKLLPHQFKEQLETESDYETILAITDFISGMTDSYAISLYRKIKGIHLPIMGR